MDLRYSCKIRIAEVMASNYHPPPPPPPPPPPELPPPPMPEEEPGGTQDEEMALVNAPPSVLENPAAPKVD